MFPYEKIYKLCSDGDLKGIKAVVDQHPDLDLNMRDHDGHSIILNLALHHADLVVPFLQIQNEYSINIHDQRTDNVDYYESETESVLSFVCRHSIDAFLKMLDYAIATNQDVNLNQRWVDDSKTLFEWIALKKNVGNIKGVLERTIYFNFPVKTYDTDFYYPKGSIHYYYFSYRRREEDARKQNPSSEEEIKKIIEKDKFMIVAGFGKNIMKLGYENYKDASFSKYFKSVFSGQQKIISLKLMILRKFVYRTDGYRSKLKIPDVYQKTLLSWPDYDYEVEKYDTYVCHLNRNNSKRKRY